MTAGLYKLNLRVTIPAMADDSLENHLYMLLTNPPIVAKLSGGSPRFVSYGPPFTVDAEESYDPIGGGELSYEWECRSLNESEDSEQVMQLLAEAKEFSSIYGTPCAVTLGKASKVTLDSKDFFTDVWVFLQVTARKEDRTAKAIQGLFVQGGSPPILSLK